MHRIAALLIVVWLWSCALVFAGPVTVINRNRLGMPPFYLVFNVQIEKHELNRELCVWWGNAEWDKSLWNKSCRQLNGLDSQRTYQYPVSNARVIRESGEFIIEAELKRVDRTYRNRVSVFVGGIPADTGGWSDGP